MIGSRSGETYRLGDSVEVRLVEAVARGRRVALRTSI